MTDKHQRWTQTHINDLRSGAAGGISFEAIAETLGRTIEDVHAMALRLRIRHEMPPRL